LLNRSLSVWAARGGHGATTIAGALAVIMNLPLFSHDPAAADWVWPGIWVPLNPHEAQVFDAGTTWKARLAADPRLETIAVLRGPCSLGALTLTKCSNQFDHLIVLREPGRSLRREDIEAVIGVAVVAEVAVTARVARLADAGLLTGRVADLVEFSELKDWALGRWPREIADAS
jgi:hypothetical protein